MSVVKKHTLVAYCLMLARIAEKKSCDSIRSRNNNSMKREKNLNGGGWSTMETSLKWYSIKMPPVAFQQVLLYVPDELPFPPVHEGYYVEGAGYRSLRLGKVEPTMWAYMPEVKL